MSTPKLHHLAVVVGDIEGSAELYSRLLSLEPLGPVVRDPQQKVFVQFLAGKSLGNLQLELLSPAGDDSPVAEALAKGGGPNHLCFEVGDLDETITSARKDGCRVICPPVDAAAMQGRRIAFVFTPDQQVMEFVSASSDSNQE